MPARTAVRRYVSPCDSDGDDSDDGDDERRSGVRAGTEACPYNGRAQSVGAAPSASSIALQGKCGKNDDPEWVKRGLLSDLNGDELRSGHLCESCRLENGAEHHL